MVRTNAPTVAQRTKASQKRGRYGPAGGEDKSATAGQRIDKGTGGTNTGVNVAPGDTSAAGMGGAKPNDVPGHAGSVGGTNPANADALTRQGQSSFAKGIAPTAYASAWGNPEALIRNWFNQQNLPVNTGYEAMAQELQPSLGIQFMAANNRAGMGAGDLDTPAYLDYVNAALGQGGRAGGESLSANAVIEALLNPQNEALKTHLGDPTMKPEDQVTNMLSAMRYGTQPNLPTPVLTALLNQVNEAGKNYQSGMLSNPSAQTQTFGQMLAGLGLM